MPTRTTDLKGLAVLMDKTAKAVVLDANAYQNEYVTRFVAEVARQTPVDVGTARSNWVVTLGAAFNGIRTAFSPFLSRYKGGVGGSIGETRNQAGVVWSAAAVLASNKSGQDVYITNNLPYIQRLNEGWSTQAPGGFVENSVLVSGEQTESAFKFSNIQALF